MREMRGRGESPPAFGMDLEIRRLDDGARFVLPRRRLGGVGLRTLFAFCMSFVFLGMGSLQIAEAVRDLLASTGPDASGGSSDALLGAAPPLVGGLIFATIGLLTLVGVGLFLVPPRASVDVRGDAIVARERLGPLVLARRGRGRITGVRIVPMRTSVRGEAVRTGRWAEMAMLRATFDAGRTLVIAPFYPAPLLRVLAERIASGAGAADGQAVEVIELEENDPLNPAHTPPAPVESAIRVELMPGGVALIESAPGTRAVLPVLVIAGAWAGLCLVLGLPVVFASLTAGAWMAAIGAAAVLLVFAGPGVAMVVWALHHTRRSTVVKAESGRFAFSRTSPLGRVGFGVDRSQIESIAVRRFTNEKHRERHVTRLLLTEPAMLGGRTRSRLTLFRNSSRDEQVYFAALLRNALGVPARSAARGGSAEEPA